MNRITSYLGQLKQEGRKALATYFVHGDPHPDMALETMHTLVESGADLIEIGVPFSDPMAEGPVIQKGHERALKHNVSLKNCIELVKKFRQSNDTIPVILMGYANPVERMGYQQFADAAAEAGVDGLLTVDIPPEEAADLQACLKPKAIESIFLLAPTSTEVRVNRVAELAGGFIYYVSLKGVTGSGNLNIEDVQAKLSKIRSASSLPILVGFGIKDGPSAKAVAQVADGVVVGSALVEILGTVEDKNQALQQLKAKVSSIRQALDN